jgi:endo-1,4-beta-xylanase
MKLRLEPTHPRYSVVKMSQTGRNVRMSHRLNSMKALVLAFLFVASYATNAQIADGKCKFLGNVISGSIPSNFSTYWNQVTPENAGKWESVEGTRDDMNWTGLDLAYNYAKSNGLSFKQHTFVWGQQFPAWISGLTPAEQKEEVEEWIRLYCERYPLTDFIDVVNEPLHAPATYASALGGAGTTGWDWVVWAFEKARQYCPNAKLALNDYNILNNNTDTNRYLEIVNILKAKGLIDIIGEQGHFLESTPLATITSNLNKFHATNVPIHISEYDVHEADDAKQKTTMEEQIKLFWNHPGVQGITFWGYRQGQIWRTNAYLLRTDNSERPSMVWLKGFIPTTLGGTFCYNVGVEDTDLGIKVFPNPSNSGTFTIESAYPHTEVEILDINGKKLSTARLTSNQSQTIHLSAAPGVYILKTFNGKAKKAQKIIVH